MRTKLISGIIAAAALATLSPSTASAQGTGTVDTSYGDPQPREDKGFPWGLLGLLGLAGLLGKKRDDRDRNTTNTNTRI